MNMNTTDKVQVGDSTTGTSTSTTASQWQTYNPYKAEQGWECPRCGRINAPWVRQCDCSRNNWTITTSDLTYKPKLWTEVTCQGTKTVLDSDTFKVHPESTIYTTNVNQIAGGSDYKAGNTYVNVPVAQSNTVNPTITTWSCTNPNNCHTPHYATNTNQVVRSSDYKDPVTGNCPYTINTVKGEPT